MRRVLIVDDESGIRNLLAEAFTDEGFEVATAENGFAALNVLAAGEPDVILLDLMMPVMDGWAFVHATHGDARFRNIPIIVLSASHDLPNTASLLQSLGVRACLAKPFDLEAVLGMVDRLTQRQGPPEVSEKPDLGHSEPPPDLGSMQPSGRRLIVE
jgi:two-component system, chemotaxis family, chemotaxis protein CheY